MWAVLLQSLFVFQTRIGAGSQLFLHHSCCLLVNKIPLSFLGHSSTVSTTVPLLGKRETLDLCLC